MNNTILEAKVEAVNKANAYARDLYAKLVDIFRPLVGQKIEKVSGQLLEKHKKLLPELPCDPKIHVYKHTSDYSLAYCVKVNAPIGDPNGPHSVTYHEVVIYIGNMRGGVLQELCQPFEARGDFTVEEVLKKRKAYREAKQLADEARDKLYPFGEYDV